MTCLQQILSVATAILILTAAEVRSFNHCPRWKLHCEKYEAHHCESGGQRKPWTSCCVPPEEREGSGGYDEMRLYPSEVYSIKTGTFSKSQVWCDMDTAGGGWVTILRRTSNDSSTNFARFQEEYRSGFGDLKNDFWLGLENMHLFTKKGDCEMRIDLYDSNNENVAHIQYDMFKVNSYPDYKLQISGFNSSDDKLYDNLKGFNNIKFTVKKSIYDPTPEVYCANNRGGWWYPNTVCFPDKSAVLTNTPDNGLWWHTKDGQKQEYHRYEMKIRPRNCR